MIQEDKDYCDLKTVLKLKSLGMNVYTSFKGIDVIKNISIYEVLKWLREEKKIYLYMDIDNEGWFFEIKCLKTRFMVNTDFFERYSTHEQAVIAGINWTLDNLI